MKHNHISQRSVFALKGQDRFSFLQGLITADLSILKSGQAVFSALLSPQGKIRFLFYIFCTDDTLYLDSQTECASALLKQLSLFKLRADIQLSPTDLHVYAGSSNSTPPENALIIAFPRDIYLGGWRALAPSAPAIPGDGDKAWLARRLEACVPELCDITPDKTIALEANLDCLGAVSWTKGCYMGQEVTARSYYRGLVKRRLAPVTLEEGIFPAEGGFISAGDTRLPLLSRHESQGLIMLPRILWGQDCLDYEGQKLSLRLPEPFISAFSPEKPSTKDNPS